MFQNKQLPSIIRECYLQRQSLLLRAKYSHASLVCRNYSNGPRLPPAPGENDVASGSKNLPGDGILSEQGRMSFRLAQMTDENLGQGGRDAEKTIQEAGFSEELKRQLEERIKDSTFKSENPAAFAQLNMPVGIAPSLDIDLT